MINNNNCSGGGGDKYDNNSGNNKKAVMLSDFKFRKPIHVHCLIYKARN